MKFTYNSKPDDSECVAYMHKSGCLIVRNDNPSEKDYCQVIGGDSNESKSWWDNWIEQATHKFYRGDSITITF